MDLDEKLEQRFVCAKCKNRGGLVKRFAAVEHAPPRDMTKRR